MCTADRGAVAAGVLTRIGALAAAFLVVSFLLVSSTQARSPGWITFAGDNLVWLEFSPGKASAPVVVMGLGRDGRTSQLFSLDPPWPGTFSWPQELAGSSTRLAVLRSSQDEDRNAPGWRGEQGLWALGPGGWRRIAGWKQWCECGVRDIAVDGDRVAYAEDMRVVIDDLSGRPPQVIDSSPNLRLELAGRFLAVRRNPAWTPDGSRYEDYVVVYDLTTEQELYRVSVPELFGTDRTPFPGNRDAVEFRIDSDGVLVVNAVDVQSFARSGTLTWYSIDEPRAHPIPWRPVYAGLSFSNKLVAFARAENESVVVDLNGNLVDHITARMTPALYNGRDWGAFERYNPIPSAKRTAFPATAPLVVDPAVVDQSVVAFRVTQPSTVSLTLDRCPRGLASGRCREPRRIGALSRRAGIGKNRIRLGVGLQRQLRVAGTYRLRLRARNRAGRRSRVRDVLVRSREGRLRAAEAP
jgi:hypothetical protein